MARLFIVLLVIRYFTSAYHRLSVIFRDWTVVAGKVTGRWYVSVVVSEPHY